MKQLGLFSVYSIEEIIPPSYDGMLIQIIRIRTEQAVKWKVRVFFLAAHMYVPRKMLIFHTCSRGDLRNSQRRFPLATPIPTFLFGHRFERFERCQAMTPQLFLRRDASLLATTCILVVQWIFRLQKKTRDPTMFLFCSWKKTKGNHFWVEKPKSLGLFGNNYTGLEKIPKF